MKPEVYAKAMFDLNQSGKSADDIVSGVLRSLKSRGASTLLPKILSAYTKLASRAGAQSTIITVARESDKDAAIKLAGVKGDTVVLVDNSLIGGYRLEGDGKLVDNSFKAKLLLAYRNATRA